MAYIFMAYTVMAGGYPSDPNLTSALPSACSEMSEKKKGARSAVRRVCRGLKQREQQLLVDLRGLYSYGLWP